MLNKSFISLTVGVEETLTTNMTTANWESDNEFVTVDASGNINAAADKLRPDGQAIITATNGDHADTCNVTIVPWVANDLILNLVDSGKRFGMISKGLDDTLYLGDTLAASLYSSVNGFDTLTAVATPPGASIIQILFTENGAFFRTSTALYKSIDGLLTWTLCIDGLKSTLTGSHTLDKYYDSDTGTVYVYLSEYTVTPSNRHKVIRGTILADNSETWETVIEFYSPNEYTIDPITYSQAANHIHIVFVDQLTGDIYVGTGDTDAFSGLYRSDDLGETWQKLGGGSQDWRTLAIWTTANNVYWNMDASTTQSIWRIAKTDLALQSTENDLKTEAVKLDGGAHWFGCWAVDNLTRNIFLVGGSAGGQPRDWLGRVYGIIENVDNSISAYELCSYESNNTSQYVSDVQLEPMFQLDGVVYFRSTQTKLTGIWKMTFSGGA